MSNELNSNEDEIPSPADAPASDGNESTCDPGSNDPSALPANDTSGATLSQQPGEIESGANEAPTKAIPEELEDGVKALEGLQDAQPGEPWLTEMTRVLTSIGRAIFMHWIITGYCAYEKARLVVPQVGRGHEDTDGEGRGACDAEVAKASGYAQSTIEDNRRIYRYCIAEGLEKFPSQERKAAQRSLIGVAARLTRTELIKCSQVVDSTHAMRTFADHIRVHGREEITPEAIGKILSKYERRTTSTTRSGQRNSRTVGSRRIGIPLGESGLKNLDIISTRLRMPKEFVIERVILYCLEHFDEFENSPEVHSI
jgi:hypothetical protein